MTILCFQWMWQNQNNVNQRLRAFFSHETVMRVTKKAQSKVLNLSNRPHNKWLRQPGPFVFMEAEGANSLACVLRLEVKRQS
jgi:hypothetical protein